MEIGKITPEYFITHSEEVLKGIEDAKKIPLLNNLDDFSNLKDTQLIRFRGIVQDMHDSEIYLEKLETKTCANEKKIRNGKYRDNTKLEPNEEFVQHSTENVYKERRSMFMVSIPGLNDWAIDVQQQQSNNLVEEMEIGESISTGNKRPLEANGSDNPIPNVDLDRKRATKETNSNSSICNNGLSKEYLLNSPIPSRPSKACIVKFYEDSSSLALNDVLEIIGFLSIDPSLCGANLQLDDHENVNEICAMNPPPSLIPRIHVVSFRSLAHLNPLLDTEFTLDEQEKSNALKDLRIAFTQCLLGDSVAADFLLCHLISTVYVRSDETLGQFSLNITNFPADVLPDYARRLYEIIELLLPASHYLPVTLDNLNTIDFIPTKDYETGKLTSGMLQLAPHTHLVLDETCLQPGKLESRGIESVMHISNLIRFQKLNVNFKFYSIDYNANVPVLVFSEGKSMFPSNAYVPLKMDQDSVRIIDETFVAVKQFLIPKLDVLRRFLTVHRLVEFDMNPESMEMIQNDFVEMRRNFNATAEDLHCLLILSRMMGILQGKKVLDTNVWNEAKRMEEDRRCRIELLPKK